jgi:branched-chain amino acid transport system substrate-binding protein
MPALPSSVYDAVLLVALAIEQAQSLEGPKIRDALFAVSKGGSTFGPLDYAQAVAAIRRGDDIDYQGASGSCDFDDNGDVLQDEIVWKVQGGAFRTEAPIPAATLQ